MTDPYRIHRMNFGYEAKPVLEEIDLAIKAGEFIGVIGPNGSGKTTLLKLLAAILKPETGDIRFDGQNIHNWSRKALAQKMALVPQETVFLYTYTVLEIVLMG